MSASEVVYGALLSLPRALQRRVKRAPAYNIAAGEILYDNALKNTPRSASKDYAHRVAIETLNLIADGKAYPTHGAMYTATDQYLPFASFMGRLREFAYNSARNNKERNGQEDVYNVLLEWLGIVDNEWYALEASAADRRRKQSVNAHPAPTYTPTSTDRPRARKTEVRESVKTSPISLRDTLINADNKIPVELGVRYADGVFTSYLNVLRKYVRDAGLNFDDLVRVNDIEILEELSAYRGRENPIIKYAVHNV